ncbi:hypothetical protein Anas_08926 [Armadillidium nasatum]|uniref:Uncharacterized protein n=1 Tax=Armadillidium nasatum TaxID=96803 RepID=A0A5N5SYZ8_9CRUS|nr:hypothetical protein Anas_08926 [Armadillidium nasatum]
MLYYGITFAGAKRNVSIYLSGHPVYYNFSYDYNQHYFLSFLRVGRRSFTCFCFLLGGICVISVAYVPSDYRVNTVAKSILKISLKSEKRKENPTLNLKQLSVL